MHTVFALAGMLWEGLTMFGAIARASAISASVNVRRCKVTSFDRTRGAKVRCGTNSGNARNTAAASMVPTRSPAFGPFWFPAQLTLIWFTFPQQPLAKNVSISGPKYSASRLAR